MSFRQYSKPYQPGQVEPFKLSRSKLELFSQCPRCFWLDSRLKIKRPSTPPFQINKAIDELFKNEFDYYRALKQPHPIMVENSIKAVPYQHKDLDKWRENFVGVQYLHEPTNLLIFGAVDDIWVNDSGELIVVDYKATSKKGTVNLDADWQQSYKRQLEIYQWLLKQNGFKVSQVGYFVYTNANSSLDKFNNLLEFETVVIKHSGDCDWVEKLVFDAKNCLEGEMPPVGISIMGGECEYCAYARQRTELTMQHLKNQKVKSSSKKGL
jgi:CRISPR/Cas system-associated exonuclease Cas4 (RecB family)